MIKSYAESLRRHFLRSKKNIADGVDIGRYIYFEFNDGEFDLIKTPEALIKAINAKCGIDIPRAYTPINSLNKLLEDQGLYKVMSIQSNESLALISRLKEGQNLSYFEVKELNRLLIELNYPLETPKRQLLFFS